jgi:predicted ABC-type sugar transport system permease subunit
MGVKRNLEGTNLNSENSFSALNNEEIISISELMVVHLVIVIILPLILLKI